MFIFKNLILKVRILVDIYIMYFIKIWNIIEQFLFFGCDFRRIKSEFVEIGGEGLQKLGVQGGSVFLYGSLGKNLKRKIVYCRKIFKISFIKKYFLKDVIV